MFRKITSDKVIAINNEVLENYNDAILNENLLESAINNIYQSFGGQELYSTDTDKLVQLFYSLVKNHCFIDGNKRTAIQVLLFCIDINNIDITLTDDELYDIVIGVADNTISKQELKEYFENKLGDV